MLRGKASLSTRRPGIVSLLGRLMARKSELIKKVGSFTLIDVIELPERVDIFQRSKSCTVECRF